MTVTVTGPLVLKGNIGIGTTAVAATGQDVSDIVSEMKLSATRDLVEIPATLGLPKSARAGGAMYELTLTYYPNDDATSTLFQMFWDAIEDDEGTLFFSASMRDGPISTSNPRWYGEFVVVGAAIGGNAEELSTDQQTFRLVGAPSKSTS